MCTVILPFHTPCMELLTPRIVSHSWRFSCFFQTLSRKVSFINVSRLLSLSYTLSTCDIPLFSLYLELSSDAEQPSLLRTAVVKLSSDFAISLFFAFIFFWNDSIWTEKHQCHYPDWLWFYDCPLIYFKYCFEHCPFFLAFHILRHRKTVFSSEIAIHER